MRKRKGIKRILAAALAAVLVVTGLPETDLSVVSANQTAVDAIVTEADPETLTRPVEIYGNDTENAGKITVGKSVSDAAVTLEAGGAITPADNNFIVTLSQSAQVMGLSSEIPVPIDAVFVLDTSGSMDDGNKAEAMVTAANNAIASLLAANENNRVAVVAFSSNNYGGGNSGNRAANVLSTLHHYTGDAATTHLQWVTDDGDTTGWGRNYIAGRTTAGARGNYRHGKDGGTNIQAGIALGAQQLTAVTDKTVTIGDQTITRLPFIVVLSDGAPTYSSYESVGYGYNTNTENWYNLNLSDGVTQQGPGDDPYEGNGFLAALTAAYYKGKITEHYFGASAGENNRCSIYTIGVGVDSLENVQGATDDDTDLAQITLDPATYTTGTYANTNASSYWNYGNTANEGWYYRDASYGWKTYWTNYQAGSDFTVRVNSNNSTYKITAASIAATKDYVNGNRVDTNNTTTTSDDKVVSMYAGGIAYNDDYFASSDASGLNAAFEDVVNAISLKAISSPTMITNSADFSGYVHFYDIIGEYMEVKNVRGIVDKDLFFQGKSFAQKMVNFGTAQADAGFDNKVLNALNGRLGLSGSSEMTAEQVKAMVSSAIASGNQLYYDAATGAYNNSICWWGNSYTDQHGDQQMQMLGFAADDSVEYIKTATAPADADYVCRSYYFYGAAGGAIDPVEDFLLLVVRVQTSLKDPYQQTVVVSIPASLLSVDRVLITKKEDNTYTAAVEKEDPMRIVYEVGLRSDINAQNVAGIVGDAYKNEVTTDKTAGSVDNYDASTDTYYFYTNDWDRSKSVESHERAMTKAGFDVASDNAFYTYQEDTKLYTKNGDGSYSAVTSGVVAGATYYYKRVYYDWTGVPANADGTYNCVQKEAWIAVTAPSVAELQNTVVQKDGEWYVKAGYYTASSLQITGDDTTKTENKTKTSSIVAHPRRTNSLEDSHYTVLLGNNGRLALTADEPKTVDINAGTNAEILDADGKVVTVGDVLTYKIEVVNNEGAVASATVTDKVPVGTELVDGSIAFDAKGTGATGSGAVNNGTITWNIANIPVNGVVEVSFKVKVTAAALQGATGTLENTASIQIGNNSAYETNTTKNPPVGKVVAGEGVNIEASGEDAQGGIQVGQTLIYHIYWANPEETVSDVIITDIIPTGTGYVTGSASDGGVYDSTNKKLTWTLADVQPGATGVVTFKVIVDANAKSPIENSAAVQIGENGPKVDTNPTEVEVLKGNLALTKLVANGGLGYADKVFSLELATAGSQMGAGYGLLNGTYVMTRSSAAAEESVTFANGIANVELKADETLTIKDLPAGLTLVVTEKNVPGGYTASYSAANGQVSVTAGATSALTVINTYAVNPIGFQLEGIKTLETDDFFPETTFTAVVERCTVDASTGEWTTTGETATTAQAKASSANKTGDFVFAKRTFTQADIGEHYYLITEFNNHLTGVDYDEAQYRMKLVVADDGSGQLTITPTIWKKAEGAQEFAEVPYAESMNNGVLTVRGVEFTNTYQPVETAVTLTGTKTLANRTLAANEFGFEVVEVVNGVTQEGNVSTGQNKADGSIEFRPITYYKAGTHTYIIREVDGKLANVSYDKTEYTVTVSVTDKDGRLEAAVTYHTTDGKAPVFGNVYAPGDASVVLTGTKTLTGRNLVDKEFTFEVLDAAGKVVSTGQNVGTGTGNITFTPIIIKHDASKQGSYTETLTYTVKEAIPTGGAKDPYMGYDQAVHTIQIEVKYDASTGLLTATPLAGNPVISFTNEQYPNSVTVYPQGSKSTTIADGNNTASLDNATFSFSVVNTETGIEATTGIGAANGDIRFGALNFTAPGTYTYWIKESNAANASNGITYDKSVYLMTVVISEKMVPTVTYAGYTSGDADNIASYSTAVEKPAFANEYNANGSLNLIAHKELQGRTLQAGEFSFKLERDNGGEIDGLVDANGVITFATMYYSMKDLEGLPSGQNSKVITYTMSEVIPSTAKLPGVIYDTTTHTVDVRLTDNGNGVITAELIGVDNSSKTGTDTGITFTNKYQATAGTSATMEVAKVLNGRDLADGEFTFELWYVDGSQESLVTTTTNQSGKASFTRNYLPEAVVFPTGSQDVTYTYIIREQAGNLPGVTYDTKEIGVQVTVHNNTDLAQLEVVADRDIKYFECENGVLGNPITDTSSLKFENTYKSEGTSITPSAVKILENRTMKDDEFSFEVRSLDADNNVSEKPVSVGLSKADGTVAFTPIGYSDRTGTGTVTNRYVISEVKGNLGGVTYSEAKYYLKVVVTDEGIGELKAVATYHTDIACESAAINASDVKFINTYNTSNGIAQLHANKILTGRDMIANEFDFVVKAAGTDKVVAYGDNTAAKAGVAAGITFTTISYSLVDMQGAVNGVKTFEYTISEVKPVAGHLNGITIDETVYTAKVTVTDNGAGMLIVDPIKYYDKDGNEVNVPEFKNTYQPEATDITLTASKILKEKKLLADEFCFVLKDSEGNIVKDASGNDIKVTNDGNGLVTFPAVPFDAAGDYTYYVEEVKSVNIDVITDATMQDNYYFDPTSYKVVVSVTDDKVGHLHATAKYFNGNTEVKTITFANMYTPDKVTAELSAIIGATKDVVDTDNNVIAQYPLNGFQFVVTDIYGKEVTTGISGTDGKITFNPFTFEQADEYRYWISEVASGKPGITDDTRQWELHIHVKNNPDADNVQDIYGNTVEMGKLYVAELKVYAVSRSGEEDTPKFINTYDPAPAALTITADKHLSGRPLKANEFTFRLMDGNLIVAEAQNSADGKIAFNIDVDTAGKHTYTIHEITPEQKDEHIHYDNKVASVEVEVDEDYSGQLKIDGQSEITVDSNTKFENVYTPTPVSVELTAKKVLNGAGLTAKAFDFELVDESGTVVARAANDAAGNVVFKKLVFTKPDLQGAAEITRNYTIREVIGNDSNITYDKTVYTARITVTDDMAGQLHAKVTYGTADGTAPVFTNTYTAPVPPTNPKVMVKLQGTKALLGGTLKDGQFQFQVHMEDGRACGYGTNKADGTIEFYEMAYDTVGRHVVTVSEINDEQSGIVYDAAKFEVVIDVYSDNGTLKARVYYPEGGVAFVNRTAGYVSPVTGDTSPIMLLLAAFVICGGTISGLLAWRRRKVQK